MSTFSVPIKRIRAILPHPNADAIEFAVIDGYRSIVKKGQFKADDLVAYIPEASVLPEGLLKQMGFWDAEKGKGTLAGGNGNRVKAIRLRGELSQGICLTQPDHHEGDDVAEFLGITKYEPPIPVAMSGEVFNAGQHLTIDFDVQNWKAYPDILQDCEMVVFTEKLHGTFTGIAVLPERDAHPEAFGSKKNILIFSKGLGAKGLVFKNNEANADNIYIRATRDILERIESRMDEFPQVTAPLFFLGETIGPGIQDLSYEGKLSFRLFAIANGYRGSQRYYNYSEMHDAATYFKIDTVPELYRGSFSCSVMRDYTDGKTTIGGKHIREGIVMVPVFERYDPRIGRVALKSVSADYLTRRGGTEYN